MRTTARFHEFDILAAPRAAGLVLDGPVVANPVPVPLPAYAWYGTAGDDTYAAGPDGEWLNGAGADTLWGGTGADRFAYSYAWGGESTAGARDVIRDFEDGIDRLDLADIDPWKDDTYVDDACHFVGTGAFDGLRGAVRYGHAGGQTIVQVDVTGDTVTDIEVALDGVFALTAADFIL
jgi:Ca2+-binding RTX toxin-like protein